MSLTFDLFWSFRSPFSYLATPRLMEIHRHYDVDVRVRVVYPQAVRNPDFFDKANPLNIRYIILDSMREAAFRGIPIVLPDPPSPDPVDMDMNTFYISPEQPLLRHLMHLGVAAAYAGKGLAFITEIARNIWSGEVKGWDKDEHMQAATIRAGLELGDLEAWIKGREEQLDGEIEDNHIALAEAGHWGVPTMVFNGQPFFGQDRIDQFLWAMRKEGLQERTEG